MTSLDPQEIGSVAVSDLQQLKSSQLKVTVKERDHSIPDIQISQPGICNNMRYIRSFNFEWCQWKS